MKLELKQGKPYKQIREVFEEYVEEGEYLREDGQRKKTVRQIAGEFEGWISAMTVSKWLKEMGK